MTDKFDILIFIYERQREFLEDEERERGCVSWTDMVKYFVDEAPPFRHISKRTLHLWLHELIEDGLVEKIIDQKTLKPAYRTTKEGYNVARKKRVEKEWIEEIKRATEKVFLDFVKREESSLDFISAYAESLKDAWEVILKDVFNMTDEEFEAIYNLYLVIAKEMFPYKSFYLWMKNHEYENLKLEDIQKQAKTWIDKDRDLVIIARYVGKDGDKNLKEDWEILQKYIKKANPRSSPKL